MNKEPREFEDELCEEYDLTQLLKNGIRGKYAALYRAAQARDTHPLAEDVQIRLLRQASIAERLAVMRSLSRTTIQLSRRAIQRANPTYSQLDVGLAFVAYHYGEELAQRLRRYLERRSHASS